METEDPEGHDCASILDLPDEILEYILAHTSPYEDFKSLMLVCKRFYKLISGDHGVSRQQYDHFHQCIQTGNLQWQYKAPDPGPTITERYSHSTCYLNKCLYMFGGCTSSSTTFNDLWRFDLALQQWVRPLAMGVYPSPKACSSMVTYRDSLILFGGWSHPTPYPLHQAARFFNELHIYTSQTNRWAQITTQLSPPGTAGHAASILGDNMVVFGGSHGPQSGTNALWVFNFALMEWNKRELQGPKPDPRYGHSQVVLDESHLLVIGGCGGPNMQFNDMWLLMCGEETWTWKEVTVVNQLDAVSLLWCHPACKVGDKVAFLSKTSKPMPSLEHVVVRQKTKMWVPPKMENVSLKAQTGRQLSPKPWQQSDNELMHDSSDSSSQNSSSSEGEEMDGCSRDLPAKRPAYVRSGMPSVRPNAMKNRQRQLHMLRVYEERIKNQQKTSSSPSSHVANSNGAASQAGRSNRPEAARKPQPSPTSSEKAKLQNPMYIHVLDISEAVEHGVAKWLPIIENFAGCPPEETIFYSLTEGRGELILFGGIQTDIHSMQRGKHVDSQTVSNDLHFISARTILR